MSITFEINTPNPINYEDPKSVWASFSNINAREVFDLLSIPFDYCGSIRGRDLLNECHSTLSLMRMTGLSESDHIRRIEALRDVAEHAGDLGLVVWG
jgi:hypothetical protein